MKIIRKEIIFGLTQERAREKLFSFVNNELLVYEVVEHKNRDYVRTNLREVFAFTSNKFTHGMRCEVAHVDKDISIRYLEECIKPIVVNSFGESGKIKYY